jgi:3-isopropylmalate dehydrogenase
MHTEAQAVRDAVQWTMTNGKVTKDINATNHYPTSVVGDIICRHITRKPIDKDGLKNLMLRLSTII